MYCNPTKVGEIVSREKDCTLKEKMLVLKKFKETFLLIVYFRA